MGSVVFPNAEYKIYLDADENIRGKRRENQSDSQETIEEIKPFLEGGRGLKKAAQLIRAGAPRIFGIPAAAYSKSLLGKAYL